MAFAIVNVKTEYQVTPLGLDCPAPRFSWQMESDQQGKAQTGYRIKVIRQGPGELVWDSGEQRDSRSDAVVYDGADLAPRTRYRLEITVWDEKREKAEVESWFETGLLEPGPTAWQGAEWIGPPRCSLCSEVAGVFEIEAVISIPAGSRRGGIVFGAGDPRLQDRYKNIFLLQTEHFIAYELDISHSPARLVITRGGYAPGDSPEKPLAQTELSAAVLPAEKNHDFHTLTVRVEGNLAKAYLNGKLADGVAVELPYRPGETVLQGRQLNPLGENDVITFPRLGQIGFCAPAGSKLLARELTVRNVRQPRAILSRQVPGKESIFSSLGQVGLEDGCFVVEGAMVTADPSHGAAPMLRCVFAPAPGKRVSGARLYVTARGIYEGYINGRPLSEYWFQPGASQFDRHLYYQAYDVTELLGQGENALGFTLASGWWSDAQTYTLANYNYYGDRPCLLAKLVLTYEDGSTEELCTNRKGWRYYGEGPVRYAGFFHGEQYDARREEEICGFSQPGFDDSGWEAPGLVEPVPMPAEESFHSWPAPNHTRPEIVRQAGGEVGVAAVLTATGRREPRPGVYLYDMGQNMVGVPRLRLRGKAGQRITLRYAEIIYPGLAQYGPLAGLPLMENLRDAACTDVYTCKGLAEGEVYMPRFTFHGYRYLEITGTAAPPAPEEVEGVVLSSLTGEMGEFSCSDPMVNRLFENIIWSQRANFISIPTDCPQRNERMGWMGDAQVFARTAAYNADVRLFFTRYLQMARDLQGADGRYPNIAPVGGGFGGIAWECAGILIPWEVYRQYGDRRVVEENFKAMEQYMEYLWAHCSGGLTHGVGMLGDWLATEEGTDNHLLWNAIHVYCAKLMAKMAGAIGKTTAAEEYRRRFEQLRYAWNAAFVDPATGKTRSLDGAVNDTQCSYALPLAYGVFSEENTPRAAGHLDRKTRNLGYTLTTGFLGTGLIAPALSENGYGESACRLLRQTEYPSWLYSVTQGATTIWERWNSFTVEKGFGGNNSMNSFNHYSLGAVGAWLYAGILGIRPLEQEPGYHRFELKPQLYGLDWAKGDFHSPYGRIACAWKREGEGVSLELTVPANTRARVTLPEGEISGAPESFLPLGNGLSQGELGSGCYRLFLTC